MKTKVHRCARDSWPVDWDVTYQLWRHWLSRRHASLRKWGRMYGYKTYRRKFSLLFKHGDRGRIETGHLYGVCWGGWYYYLAQHSLCRPAWAQEAPRRSAQFVVCRIAVPATPRRPYRGQFLWYSYMAYYHDISNARSWTPMILKWH